MTKKSSVLLMDAHPIARTGVARSLSDEYEVIAEVGSSRDLLAMARRYQPDVVVMCLGHPPNKGYNVIRGLRKVSPVSKILIFSQYDTQSHILESAQAGAHGFISKRAGENELIESLETLTRGGIHFENRISRLLKEKPMAKSELTTREKEVLILIAEGLTNKAMGKKLSLSSRTIETHRERIMEKLGIKSVAGLTRYAIKQGLTEL